MSRKRKRLDPNQLAFDFDHHIQEYRELKEEILSPSKTQQSGFFESREEACIEVAVTVKQAIRKSGLSREQVVDTINEYFGDSKALSIHMFNHYLSKPVEYPMPAYLIYPIQRITTRLDPTIAFAEAEGAKVISKDEVREWAVGKLDSQIIEMQKLKRELRSGR